MALLSPSCHNSLSHVIWAHIRNMKVLHGIHLVSCMLISVEIVYYIFMLVCNIDVHRVITPTTCYIAQRAVTAITAHNSPLAAVSFDSQGTLIATASEKV